MIQIPRRVTLEIVPLHVDGRRGRPRRFPANSWLRQMARMVFAHALESFGVTALDTSGNTRSLNTFQHTVLRCNGGAGDTTQGIQLGTSVTAPGRDDYALGSLIGHGAGAGQLQYGAMSFSPLVSIAGGYRVSLERTVSNGSGAGITVNEIGLAVIHEVSPSDPGARFLILRDLVPGGELVPDGEARVFRYHLDFLV